VHEGIAEVTDISFEDGSRWEGLWVIVPDGQTPEQAVDETIQSLMDQGELELSLERLDDPVSEIVSWFAQRKLGLVVERDDLHGDWMARLTRKRDGRVLQPIYGSGPTPADAALRAQERYKQEQ
jgi:hypothetical protein